MEKIKKGDILNAVEDWVLELSELALFMKNKIDNTLFSELNMRNLNSIRKFKSSASKYEKERFNYINEFLKNLSQFRWVKYHKTLQEINWKTYIIIDESEKYEVIEKIWSFYIAYDHIKGTTVIYRVMCSKKEIIGNRSIRKLFDNCQWFSDDIDLWDNTDKSIISIWKYKKVECLGKYWDTFLFVWELSNRTKEIIVLRWITIKKIPFWTRSIKKTSSNRTLLFIFNHGISSYKVSLFYLDNMNYIFENADYIDTETIKSESGDEDYVKSVCWHHNKDRTWMLKGLWKKTIREKIIF